ncbi:pyridoxal phosphate-dependent aminotransferase [Vibrio alginolyticus]
MPIINRLLVRLLLNNDGEKLLNSNKFVKNLKPYKLSSHKVWEIQKSDSQYLKLDWNESTLNTPDFVKKAIVEHLDKLPLSMYPNVANAELNKKLAEYSGVSEQEVLYFGSSDVAHEVIVRTFISEGDKVLIFSPTYDNFRITVEAQGAEVEYADFWLEGVCSEEDVKTYIREFGPKLIYICNPNNPTGEVISQSFIESIASKNADKLFVIDEAYFEFYGESSVGLLDKLNNIVITRTFSKALSIAGCRFGYVITSEKIIAELNKIRNAKNIPALTQVAAESVLDNIGFVNEYVESVNEAKDYFVGKINEINISSKKVINGHANFILIEFEDETDKDYFVGGLARNNIFVRDMSHVDSMSKYVRITMGTVTQMSHVVNVLLDMYKS